MSKIKLFLWKLGMYPNRCPYCGQKLMEHGYWPYDHWTCQEGSELRDCKFNEVNND